MQPFNPSNPPLTRARKIEALTAWVQYLKDHDDYTYNLMKQYSQADFNKMRIRDLTLIINMVKTTYHTAYRTSRSIASSTKGSI